MSVERIKELVTQHLSEELEPKSLKFIENRDFAALRDLVIAEVYSLDKWLKSPSLPEAFTEEAKARTISQFDIRLKGLLLLQGEIISYLDQLGEEEEFGDIYGVSDWV